MHLLFTDLHRGREHVDARPPSPPCRPQVSRLCQVLPCTHTHTHSLSRSVCALMGVPRSILQIPCRERWGCVDLYLHLLPGDQGVSVHSPQHKWNCSVTVSFQRQENLRTRPEKAETNSEPLESEPEKAAYIFHDSTVQIYLAVFRISTFMFLIFPKWKNKAWIINFCSDSGYFFGTDSWRGKIGQYRRTFLRPLGLFSQSRTAWLGSPLHSASHSGTG